MTQARSEPNAEFDSREVACESEASARAEAERQRLAEDSTQAEWIYLRNREGQWVARRTPRDLVPRSTFWGALRDWLLGWLNPFPGP